MYDVHGKSVGGDKGKIQEAVEKWEKAANESAPDMPEIKSNGEADDAISEKIKNNIQKINKAKSAFADTDSTQSADKAENILSDEKTETIEAAVAEPLSQDFDKPVRVNSAAEIENTFESEDQFDEMLSDQSNLIFSFAARFIGCLLCTILLIWFALAPVVKTPLPPYADIGSNPSGYMAVNLILLLLTGILGFSVAVKGIASLFTLKPDADSLTSLSFYAALINVVYMLCSGASADSATAIFSSCAAACVTFNLFGKIFLITRVKNNLKFAERLHNKDGFYAANQVEPEAAQNIFRTFQGVPLIIRPEKVKFLESFMEQSYMESIADKTSRVQSPIVLVAAICAAAGEILLKGQIAGAVTVFSAICCIASPLMLEAGVAVPFYRACKKLVKKKALVTGCGTVSQFGGADVIIADGNLIFPGHNIKIHRVKTFAGHDINEAVLYASSIACAGKSPLLTAFMGIFADAGSGRKLIKECEKIVYEDEKGLCAIIDGRVVLLGNRGILRHHLIETPSRDFEIKNTGGGKDIVYLAIDGKVCAMFVVSYDTDSNITSIFRKLRRYGIQLLIESTDPNINPLLIEEKCGLVADNTEVLGAAEMQNLKESVNDGGRQAGLAFSDLGGYVSSVLSCIKLNGSMRACTVLQILFSLFGILMVVYAAFFAGGIGKITPVFVLAFQFLCAVPVLLIMLFRRN